MENCKASSYASLMSFRRSTVKSILNSNFKSLQFTMMHFIGATVAQFEGNTLDGINKGIKFSAFSKASITNSTFKNFVQNIEENGATQSELSSDGSAICK